MAQGCASIIIFDFHLHTCTVSEDVMTLKVYTRHAEYLPTQLIYNVHGLSLDFCCTRLSTKAAKHSGAALTSKGSERHVMQVPCQNIPAAICICSGTVLGCHEAVVRTLPSVSPEVVEETFFLFSSGEWEAACDASSPLDTPGS